MAHYLDNSATTMLCDSAKAAMKDVMDGIYGNPSSLHAIGLRAQKVVDDARKILLSTFLPAGVRGKPEQLVFTSGGTEANNLALIGTAASKPRNAGKKIIVGETEHSSVLACAAHLASLGFKVSYIPSPRGVWDMERFRSELTPDTILVSAMLVNNETGAVNDIAGISAAARAVNPDVIVHCDAVQGYLRLNPSAYSAADLVSVSAHKIGGPKGAGALFISENILKKRAISPVIFGGGQEHGLRSGTENVMCIAGFGAAAEYYKTHLADNQTHFSDIYGYAAEKLGELSEYGIRINFPESENHAFHIINITVGGVKSETMLHFLSSRGVYVSSGSACASNTNSKSHVLKSFGLPDDEIDSSLRLSFGLGTSREDIDKAASALIDGVKELSRKRSVLI